MSSGNCITACSWSAALAIYDENARINLLHPCTSDHKLERTPDLRMLDRKFSDSLLIPGSNELAKQPLPRLAGRVAGKNIVFFDLETQRSFGDVGGFSNKGKMGISIAVTYSTARGTYEIYRESELDQLGEELCKADLVVGWNHLQFDYPVLQPHIFPTLADQTINLDMMLDLEQKLGFRLKLDSAASASLGIGKTADGLDALRWWQEYKKTGEFTPLRKIAEYCAYDVKVTRCVYEYAMEHGHLKYGDRNGQIQEIAVDWQ